MCETTCLFFFIWLKKWIYTKGKQAKALLQEQTFSDITNYGLNQGKQIEMTKCSKTVLDIPRQKTLAYA